MSLYNNITDDFYNTINNFGSNPFVLVVLIFIILIYYILFAFLGKNNNSESIVFENVDFKYFNSDVYIFKNLSLKIPKNKHTILTGANGSGKSTLLGLVSGVFYSESGTVYANCEKFGYIGATPLIFDSSLRENILYGNDVTVSDEEILKELRVFNTFKELAKSLAPSSSIEFHLKYNTYKI